MTTDQNVVRDDTYDASHITALEETEAVRLRPGMYIGPTDMNGLHHMIREVVDNSVDEALAGHANHITITILKDASVRVTDNGRGIPVDVHPKHNVSGLELAATKLHAGGKFGQGGYKVSSGLHGVGLSVVNALSEWMRIEVKRHHQLWVQEYRAGKPQGAVRAVGAAEGTGTSIHFLPDVLIFKEGLDYTFRVLAQRFREMAYLTKGLRFHFVDERTEQEVNFYFEGGVISYVRHLNKDKTVLHRQPFYVERTSDDVAVEIAMQYTETYDTDSVYTFANNINNTDGGAHLTGFRTALTRVINTYARAKGMLKDNETNLTGDDVREGLTAVISVKLRDPQFSSQTKEKLVSPEAASAVATVVGDTFAAWLDENPGEARRIIEKAISAARTRLAVQKVRETARKSAMEGFSLPGKLADCSDTNPARCELYIVEGDSAGGCLGAETGIPLASGLVKTMRELAQDWEQGIHHFGYATNDEGDIRVVPLLEPRLTKQQAPLVEVVLDNGERIHCTFDHPFRLRDGSYCAAGELQPGVSLMSFKTRLTNAEELPGPGYEMVWMHGQSQWCHTHHLADLYNLLTGVYTRKAGNTRHHKDFNKLNNDPRNIERMPWRAHQRLHSELAGEMARRLWKDPIYRERKIRQLSEQARQQWQDPAYRQYMSERVKLQHQDETLNAKLLQGVQNWFQSLTPEAYTEYCERMRSYQEAYWSSPEHRRLQSEATKHFFEENPQARIERHAAALIRWENAELRAWRAEKNRQQWQDEAYRYQHSVTVTQWWMEHPEYHEKIVAARQRERADEEIRTHILTALSNRRDSTSTEEKGARIRQGHKLKALLLLNQVLADKNIQQAYEDLRVKTAPTAISYDHLCRYYFAGEEQQMLEAATHVNCKVVAVHQLEERADVYDLTVDDYHNFALAAGVFVHNSAKQGRDRRFQAILPLRGKILNVEKSRLDKMLSNAEVKAMITAIGTAIGEQFSTDKLRYHRILLMSVAGDEPTLVSDENGCTELVKIGDFIDDCIEGRRITERYSVVSFDHATHTTRFRPLKAVIRHSHEEALYRITTRYNRSIKVTASHSVFVFEDGQVRLKRGNAVQPGDLLVASRCLPRPATSPTQIDLLETLYRTGQTEGLYLQGEDVRKIASQRVMDNVARPELWSEPRVVLNSAEWQQLVTHQQATGLSQMQVATAVGVQQPIIVSHWECGKRKAQSGNQVSLSHFARSLSVQNHITSHYSPVLRFPLCALRLDRFTPEEVAQLGAAVQIVPRAHSTRAFGRYLPITRDLVWLLGWYAAEGTLSAHQVSLNLGQKDVRFIPELSIAIQAVCGEVPCQYHDPDSDGIKLYFHSVTIARLLQAWGLTGRAHTKRVPNMLFSLPEELQLAFLEGYFLGDGTISGTTIKFITSAPDLKDGLLYMLGQLGLVATTTEMPPGTAPDAPIQTRHPYYTIALGGKEQLERCRPIWQRHANAPHLANHLSRPTRNAPAYVPIGADLIGLEVIATEEVAPVGEYVYDFSVQDDENFVCGTGGLYAHNTDADVDGSHIRTLLLTFFFRYMRPLIVNGHLYIAQPPLYRLKHGKQQVYVYSDTEKDDYIARLPEGTKVDVQRYKGLGEMNPDQLWETTMNPTNRVILQVTLEDAQQADETFTMLMGDMVPPRRKFIQAHASEVRNLDI